MRLLTYNTKYIPRKYSSNPDFGIRGVIEDIIMHIYVLLGSTIQGGWACIQYISIWIFILRRMHALIFLEIWFDA